MANASKNILNSDVEIRGNLKCTGDLSFDGKLEGDLATDSHLDLGENTMIKGNINAASAVVRGKILGSITAKDKLEIKTRTELAGDLRGAKLVVEEGVAFTGKAEINPAKATAAPPAAHGTRPSDAYKASEPTRMGR